MRDRLRLDCGIQHLLFSCVTHALRAGVHTSGHATQYHKTACGNQQPTAQATDLRTLAMGFRDLAKSAAEPPKPAVTESKPSATTAPPPAPVKPAEPVVYGAQHSDVKKPVAMAKPMPEWRPASQTEQKMVFEGALEFIVGEDGRVVSVRLLESVHQSYDPALLKTAMSWTFKPATRNGVPVRYRYAVSIRLGG